MKKILIILITIFSIYFIFKYWQSKQPCPINDPAGLYKTCKAEVTDNPNDPLGLFNN